LRTRNHKHFRNATVSHLTTPGSPPAHNTEK